MTAGVKHGLSFDIECYNQIISKDFLHRIVEPLEESERNTNWILDLLAKTGRKATFFFLGNMARKFPELVKRAVDDGHEIGVHGDAHRYIHRMTRDEFSNELDVAIDSVEQAGGARVVGHRAPAFSIVRENLWALDVIAERGLLYDSSIFPFKGRRYGIPDWQLEPSLLKNNLWEIPMSINETRFGRLPCMGGGYFRYFPYAYTRYSANALAAAGRNGVTYFHPHEFDHANARFPDGARAQLGGKDRLRLTVLNTLQSRGRRTMRQKLERFLGEFDTVPISGLLPENALKRIR